MYIFYLIYWSIVDSVLEIEDSMDVEGSIWTFESVEVEQDDDDDDDEEEEEDDDDDDDGKEEEGRESWPGT